ncbi:MAG: hypothetical protein OWU33_09745 [Firmicutes bacterium]|nr:hypothetical protein [Bacillota bacterium]
MKRWILSLVASVAAVGAALALVVGLYWTLAVAPLILFLGMAVTYAIMASRSAPPKKPSPPPRLLRR